jgi:type I restriction enzyme, S subunit
VSDGRFKAYPDYKDSMVERLGDVPAHWAVKRLKHNLRLLTEKTERRENPVALENIESWTGRFLPTETEFEGEGIAFHAGDILFGKLRPYLAKAYRAESAGEAVGDFHVMRPVKGIDGRYAQYQILNREFIAVVDGSTFGSKMPRASWEFVGAMEVTTPPLPEQTQIAKFLDHETAKIDRLIEKQQALIALLKEKRQAVISHAVTKGLNPHAPLKDSGIEWLGEIPSYWNVLRLKNISPRISGRLVYQPAQYFSSEGIPFLMGNNVTERGIDWNDAKLIPEPINRRFSQHALAEGDVITVRVGAPGVTCVVSREAEGLNCGSLMIIRRTGTFDSHWLSHVMNSPVVRTQIDRVQYGAAQEQINISDAVNFLVPTPPLAEQTAIVRHLETEIAKFDVLTAKAQRTTTLLQERRTALISAAVTGKIDVRAWQPPVVSEMETTAAAPA